MYNQEHKLEKKSILWLLINDQEDISDHSMFSILFVCVLFLLTFLFLFLKLNKPVIQIDLGLH